MTSFNVSRAACQISCASCSTHPDCGKCWVELAIRRDRRPPIANTARVRTPVVPASRARTQLWSMSIDSESRRTGPASGAWRAACSDAVMGLSTVRFVGAGRAAVLAFDATARVRNCGHAAAL